MSEYLVHLIPGSPFARAVLATLEEKHTPYGVAAVLPGTLRSPQHLSLHPFGRVPVLEHGDFRLYETQAMLRYLDRVLPDPPLTPADARRAARMDQAMNVNDWYLFHGVGNVIIFHRIIAPQLMGAAPDEEAIKWMTINPAWALGLDDRIGSLVPGKNADVVLWSGNPCSVYAHADKVWIDGAMLYDRSDPEHRWRTDFDLGYVPAEAGR